MNYQMVLGWDQATNNTTHQEINSYASIKFNLNYGGKEKYKNSPIDLFSTFTGRSVTARGYFEASYGSSSFSFKDWIIHGGFSADEPEVGMGMRHFFDPKASNGVFYLTDQTFLASLNAINPQIDARWWALCHTGHNDFGKSNNTYNWNQALNTYKRAMENTLNREENFAASFRALGEVMHTVADMTVPAHVRNDGHLTGDIHESVINNLENGGSTLNVIEFSQIPVPDEYINFNITKSTGSQMDALDIINKVSLFTHDYFYSDDTIYNGSNPTVNQRNGEIHNDKPTFNTLKWNESIKSYEYQFSTTRVRMIQRTVLDVILGIDKHYQIPSTYVLDQGRVLIPVAIDACSEAIDRFFPTINISTIKIQETGNGFNLSADMTHVIVQIPAWKVRYVANTNGNGEISKTPITNGICYVGSGVIKRKKANNTSENITQITFSKDPSNLKSSFSQDLNKGALQNGDIIWVEVHAGARIYKSPEQTVTIAQSSNSTIDKATETFDKKTPTDISVNMTLIGSTVLSSIKNGSTALTLDKEYTKLGNTVKIKTSYLATLAIGKTTLTFDFSAGTDPTLAITVVDNSDTTPDTVAQPTFTPPAGTYASAQSVTLSSTPGATIKYTTDSVTVPSKTLGTIYIGTPIVVDRTMTLQAIAYKTGMTDSSVSRGVYTISSVSQTQKPVFTPAEGAYTTTQNITISCPTMPTAAIRYTLDGTTPNANNGFNYLSPVKITATTTLNAYALASGKLPSEVRTAIYTINPVVPAQQVADPVITPAGGTYDKPVPLGITCTTPGATIRVAFDDPTFSNDNDDPTPTSGYVWTPGESTTAMKNMTVKAIAYKSGLSTSNVRKEIYTINLAPTQSVAKPIFNIPSNTYTSVQNLTISCATSGATIKYTRDGTIPSPANGIVFITGSSIPISASVTIKAIAYKADMTNSEIESATYTINLPSFLTLNIDLGSGVNLEMIKMSRGTFQTGSPGSEPNRYSNEGPVHSVTLSKDFYIGKFEVTQGQWKALMNGTNPSHFKNGDNYPVNMVSWNNICGTSGFIEKLNILKPSGHSGFRLPTEAEWEYSCRADTATSFYWGNDPSYTLIGGYIWYTDNSGHVLHPVGQKLPNAFGLYDMLGNAEEWCNDWYEDYSSSAAIDPIGAAMGGDRVIRGGSFSGGVPQCRSAYRRYGNPSDVNESIGFRLVLPAGQSPTGNSDITPKTVIFDKNPTIQSDIAILVALNGNTLNAIKNGSNSLTLNTDYTKSINTVTIKKEYLAKMSVGTTTLTFDFNAGNDMTLAVTVSDTTPTADPIFTPDAGTYPSPQNVVITCMTSGADIYYTTDGSTPDAAKTKYTVPINVAQNTTIKAIAIKSGITNSAVKSSTYVISDSRPVQTITIDLGNGANLEMVKIPAGTFQMGSPDTEQGKQPDEGPVHNVTISKDYYIGKYEVTQGQWKSVMNNANPSNFKTGDNYPVEQVSWNEITDNFIPAINSKGLYQGTFRLPTEAEWEYACRAGSATAYYWSASMDGNYCWYGSNSGNTTHAVGQKLPNAFGLHDMSGNVVEWCSDWYGMYPSGPVTDPTGPASGSQRVERGGGWDHTTGEYWRSASRLYRDYPSYKDINRGFRLALSPASPLTGQIETPANNASGIALNSNLTMSFSENVIKYTGNITIKKISDNSILEIIDVSGNQVNVSGNKVTIMHSNSFAYSTGYYVQIDQTCFKNSSGGYFQGISDSSSWRFTTLAQYIPPPPPVDAIPPTVNANLIFINSTHLKLTFSEPVNNAANNVSNYTIGGNGGLTGNPASAIKDANNTDVTLEIPNISTVAGGNTITITVTGVSDLAGNPISSTNVSTYTKITVPAPDINRISISASESAINYLDNLNGSTNIGLKLYVKLIRSGNIYINKAKISFASNNANQILNYDASNFDKLNSNDPAPAVQAGDEVYYAVEDPNGNMSSYISDSVIPSKPILPISTQLLLADDGGSGAPAGVINNNGKANVTLRPGIQLQSNEKLKLMICGSNNNGTTEVEAFSNSNGVTPVFGTANGNIIYTSSTTGGNLTTGSFNLNANNPSGNEMKIRACISNSSGNQSEWSDYVNATYDIALPEVNGKLIFVDTTHLKIKFSETVDDTSNNPSNYVLSGTGGFTGNPSSAAKDANGVDVILTVPDVSALLSTQNIIVTVNGVKDISGNIISGNNFSTYSYNLTGVTAVNDGKLTLTFNGIPVLPINTSDFTINISINGSSDILETTWWGITSDGANAELLNIPLINASSVVKNVIYKVSFKDGPQISSVPFTVQKALSIPEITGLSYNAAENKITCNPVSVPDLPSGAAVYYNFIMPSPPYSSKLLTPECNLPVDISAGYHLISTNIVVSAYATTPEQSGPFNSFNFTVDGIQGMQCIDSTHLKLSFTKEVDDTANISANYELSGTGGLTGNPSAAVKDANGVDVVLTVPDLSGLAIGSTIVVTANGVNDLLGNTMCKEYRNTASYNVYGLSIMPGSLWAVDSTHLTLIFNQPIDDTTNIISNYVLSGTGGITGNPSAVVKNGNDVLLTVPDMSSLTQGQTVIVTLSGIKSSLGKLIDANNNTTTYTVLTSTPPGTLITAMANVNGTIIGTFNSTPVPPPTINDFSITMSINGGIDTSVSATAINNSDTIVTLTVPVITQTYVAQSVFYKISYKGGTQVPTNPLFIPGL